MKLKKNDKSWWRLNRELLNKKSKVSSIPSLRDEHGQWLMDPKKKANEFVRIWNEKINCHNLIVNLILILLKI